MRFNTAVSAMMILVKQLQALPSVPKSAVEPLVLLLAPFAPHIAEELWQRFGHAESLTYAPWPTFDAALCEDAEVEIGVQVNGKARSVVKLAKDASQESAVAMALADPKVQAHTDGKAMAKVVYVPGRILNLIVK
jgi:leucyl-tRNA synthetase